MGICLEKSHFGFSKSPKIKKGHTFSFNDILRLCTMYNSSQYCHMKSRLNKEELKEPETQQ